MSEPLPLYCRKTKQPVLMRPDEACQHCGQIGHGLDYSWMRDLLCQAIAKAHKSKADRRMNSDIEANKLALRETAA